MAKNNGGVKEFIRKRLVALKRKPQTIALLGLAAAFVYFSFNLTQISNTTAAFQMNGMGLSAFVIMLFSVLVIVCFLNAFPHRKKVNVPMLVLMFAMLGVTIFCNFYYDNCIDQAIQSRWDDTYNKHVSDAVKAVEEARESQTSAAALAEESAAYLAAAKADAEAAAACAEEAQKLADELAAAGDAADALKAAEDAKTAAAAAQEAAASAETAATTIANNAAEVEKAAAAAEEGEDLKAIKAAGKDAASVAKKSKNVLKNVSKAAGNAAAAKADAEAALAAVKAAAGVEEAPAAPVEEAPAEVAPAQTAAELPPVELSEALLNEARSEGDETVKSLLSKNAYITSASNVLAVHRIMLFVALALVALLPVYTPLLRKIRTSIEVEANEDMGEIELNGSDD